MTDTFYDAFSGAPATAAERRAALAELIAEGFVLGGFDVLAGLVAACPHAGDDARRVAVHVLLALYLDPPTTLRNQRPAVTPG